MSVKLNIVSDLHDPKTVDFSKFNYDADYIVVAGDSDECIPVLYNEIALRKSKAKIMYTSGNHDLFKRNRLIEVKYPVHSYESGSFKYVGCFRCMEKENNILFLMAPLLSLVPVDTKLCKKLGDYEEFRTFFPDLSDNTSVLKFNHLWNTKFVDDLTYLETFIDEIPNVKVVVITHGIPSFKLIENSIVYGSQLNMYWASDKCLFNNIFSKCSLWIHGHSHEFCDMMIDNTRCIRNPLRDYNMQIIPEAYNYTIEI